MKAIDILGKAREVVLRYSLCDACLGRLFGMLGYGLDNRDRGRAIKTLLLMEAYNALKGECDLTLISRLAASGFEPALQSLAKVGVEVLREECYVCEGIMDRIAELVDMCIRAGEGYEYRTFQVGCRLPRRFMKREEDLWVTYDLGLSESIKSELTREVGKALQDRTGRKYSPVSPDLVFILDLEKWSVEVLIKPLFIYGRYRKLVRGLPQSPWRYGYDSRVAYRTSIEELITRPLVEMARGSRAKLHAAGREDLDVRTLGNGRPFIVEVKDPRVRSLDLKLAEKRINEGAGGLVEVDVLRFVDGKLVPKLKAFAELARKTYLARVRFSQPVSSEELARLEEEFTDAIVRQRTPLRVLGRRPDKVRKKVVYSLRVERLDGREARLVITCQGGLYVKELIHGDQGRTKPSVAGVLGVDVEILELDVIWIEEPSLA